MALSAQRSRRARSIAWALAVIVLIAGVMLWFVLRADPASLGQGGVIAVPPAAEPTPLMTPK